MNRTASISRPSPRALIAIGLVAATLAVAAGFAGRSFAGAEAAANATKTVPVAQPVAFGDAPLPPATEDAYANGLSAISGSTEVPTTVDDPLPSPPAANPARPIPDPSPELRALLDAPEPEGEAPVREVLAEFGGTEAGAPPAADDGAGRALDPCAPRDGGAPSDCPEGVRSTIIADRAVPDLWVMATAYPEPPGRSTNVFCPPRPGVANAVPFGVGSIVPGTATLRYWDSRTGPGAARQIVTSTTPEARAAWETAFAAGESFENPVLRPQLCFDVPEIASGVTYDWSLVYVDIFGRVASDRVARPFAYDPSLPRGPRTRPPTLFIPISQNRILVSVAHRADEVADLRGYAGDFGGTCFEGGRRDVVAPELAARQRVYTGPQATGTVSREFLDRKNYQADFTRRSSAIVLISPNTPATLCARTFPGSGRSFETARANYIETSLVTSPDPLLPQIELIGLDLTRGVDADAIRISTIAGGYACGTWRGPGAATAPGPVGLPDGAARCDSTLAFSSSERSTNVNFRVVAELGRGSEAITTETAIPARVRLCTGSGETPTYCPRPTAQIYRLALPTVRVGSGLCSPGLFETSCTPPTREQSLGIATFRVSWSDGGGQGRAEWLVGAGTQPPPDGLAPTPQLDRNSRPSVDGARQLVGELVADRPVTWNVTTTTSCRARPAPEPVVQNTPAERLTLFVPGLCVGAVYNLRITLTDPATGATAVYGIDPDTRLWGGAQVVSPSVEVRFFAELLVEQPPRDAGSFSGWVARSANANIPWNAEANAYYANYLERCDFETLAPTVGRLGYVRSTQANIVTMPAGETTEIRFGADLTGVARSARAGDTYTECVPASDDVISSRAVVEVPLAQFEPTAGPITLRTTGGPFPVTLVLRPTR